MIVRSSRLLVVVFSLFCLVGEFLARQNFEIQHFAGISGGFINILV